MAFQKTVPIKINTAYNSTINLDTLALGKNALPNVSVIFQKRGEISQDTFYEAMTKAPENIITNDNDVYKNQIRDHLKLVPDFTIPDNDAVDDNYVTKFYLGSITLVGLYIFYRFLVKNR